MRIAAEKGIRPEEWGADPALVGDLGLPASMLAGGMPPEVPPPSSCAPAARDSNGMRASELCDGAARALLQQAESLLAR